MIRTRFGGLVLAAAVAAAACDGSVVPSGTPGSSATPARTPTPTTTPLATPRPTNQLESLSSGAWRPKPVTVHLADVGTLRGVCGSGAPAVREAELVLADVRGDRQLTLVFVTAAGDAAWVCRGTASGDVQVYAVEVPSQPVGDDGIDALLYRRLGDADGTRTLLAGRVGPVARDVIAAFDDESYVWGAEGGGWYAMWWPGAAEAANVSSVDGRNLVLEGVDLGRPE